MTSKDPKQDLLPHMTFPIPDLKHTPKPGTLSKEETLRTILANLDQHHQATRLNIIEAGKQNLTQALQAQHNNNEAETHQEPPGDSTALFLANLSYPYHDSMGDPVYSPTAPPPPPVPQATPPLTIRHTKQTLDALALYDSIALPERKFYSDALERITGPAVADPRRNSTVAPPPPVFAKPSPREPAYARSATASAGPGLFGKPSPADPRLAGRMGSGSWGRPSPVQSPVEGGRRESTGWARPSPLQSPVERAPGSAGWAARPSPVQSPVERTTDPRLRR